MTSPRSKKHTTMIAVVAVLVLAVAAGAVVYLRGAPEFGPLPGRWLRLDGGYVLEIKGVAADGRIDAAYLNPRPIPVGKAQATRDGSAVKVFVELRGPNYEGSNYTLTYDPKTDQLQGVYDQVVVRQRFNVSFVRAK